MKGNSIACFILLIATTSIECIFNDNFDTCINECRNTCKDQYLRSGGVCKLLTSGVGGKDATAITYFHNEFRSEIATGKHAAEFIPGSDDFHLPHSSDMMEMEWDEKLQKSAQAQANLCQMYGECRGCRSLDKTGQNIKRFQIPMDYVGADGEVEKTMLKSNWRLVVWSWFDEMQEFDWKKVNNFSADSKSNAFSQMIWAETMKVGCGYSVYKQDGYYYQLYICNYAPLGNVAGEPVYNAGFPCEHCPSNACCGKTCRIEPIYEGLCRIRRRKLSSGRPRMMKPIDDIDASNVKPVDDSEQSARHPPMNASSLGVLEQLP